MKCLQIIMILVLATPNISYASGLPIISISEISDKSDLIVLGQVVSVKSDSQLDFISLKIIEYIKGKTESNTISIILQVRGGLKEFDPVLKNNEFGVFYLRKTSKGYATAHGGSIAIFEDLYAR